MLQTKTQTCQPFGLFVDASGTLFKNTSTGKAELYEDAQEILDTYFKPRRLCGLPVRTALITNWGKFVHKLLEEVHLNNLFDIVVCYDTLGMGKPHKELFLHACQVLDLPLSQCFHFGDLLHDDALAAQRAGLNGIWIQREPSLSSAVKELQHPYFQSLVEAFQYVGKKVSPCT